MEYTFSQEDIKLVERFIEIKNKGYYADGGQVTAAYNRILHKNANVTNCGSCLRGRVQEMENALNHFKAQIKAQEALKEEKVDNVTPEENKASEEAENKSTIKRVGRPPKKK